MTARIAELRKNPVCVAAVGHGGIIKAHTSALAKP